MAICDRGVAPFPGRWPRERHTRLQVLRALFGVAPRQLDITMPEMFLQDKHAPTVLYDPRGDHGSEGVERLSLPPAPPSKECPYGFPHYSQQDPDSKNDAQNKQECVSVFIEHR